MSEHDQNSGQPPRAHMVHHDVGPGTPFPFDAPAELPTPRLPKPPFWMVSIALVGVVVTWLPLAIIARARVSRSTEPRVQIMQDMGMQPKFREQQSDFEFADGRADRPHVPGTVARGQLDADPAFYRGFIRVRDPQSNNWTVKFFTGFPSEVKLTDALLKRGQNRFNIYCYVCHGMDGSGHGPVNERAVQLQSDDVDGFIGMTWTQAANIAGDPAIKAQENGKLFNTITNGIRAMPGYGGQIPPDDRWAIIAYLRALQFSQSAPVSALPQDKQEELNNR